MNCPETNKQIVDPPHSGGGFPGELGGGSKCQKSGKFHELPRKSTHCCLPPPIPTQLVGGGLGVNIGGTDGREGLMGGWEGCDANYEVDPVHMAWNGCIILIGNPSKAG